MISNQIFSFINFLRGFPSQNHDGSLNIKIRKISNT